MTTNGTSEYAEFQGFNPLGELGTWRLRELGPRPNPDSLLRVDLVELADHRRAERKRLPVGVHGEADWALAEAQLDNEIRALVRLATRYPNDYPAELPRLIAYNFDVSDPFVLMEVVTGDNGDEAHRMRTLLTQDRRRFQLGMYRALAALHAVDLVHGAIRLSSIRWADDRFQLVGFEHSSGRGEVPRSRPVTVGYRERQADPADDVRDAGRAVHEMITGARRRNRPPTQDGPLDDVLPGLDGVFEPDPARRPTAVVVLAALNSTAPLPDPLDVDEALRAGWDQFDREHPRPQPVPPPRADPPTPPSAPPPPVARHGLRRRFLLPALIGAVVLGAAVVVGVLSWMEVL
ncbi:hypothetical protein FHX81_6913 [Saccharothrix saharensis]|uniref:Protein kinase domain-containing protein n=1 Tax=Saccharothrix saharensis TaxID=571190 RepID=A0A543JNN8_9PSEU|nr:hypothetical protein [Saccharothrix saharensis]TQM84467.1 hypothetical protein FHX81_6913 [Saccharothrix saharensis]